MTIEKITDHVKAGLRRLLSKEKNSTVLRAWLSSYLKQIQILEDTAWLVLETRTLDGEGAQLDAIGRLVMRGRGELDDDNYKLALRTQIRVLRSAGRPFDLDDITALSMPEGFTYLHDEDYPKSTTIEVIGGVDFEIDILWNNLLKAKPAGTRLFLVWHANDEAGNIDPGGDYFTFTSESDETDDVSGFSIDSENDGEGGYLANVYGS